MNSTSTSEFDSLIASKQFRQILYVNWKQIVANLPEKYCSKQQKYVPACEITESLEKTIKNSQAKLPSILKSRGVTGQELCESMSKLGLGVSLFKPETDMVVTRRSERVVRCNVGEPIDLFCFVESVPEPTYSFYKGNELIGRENSLKIPCARSQDSGEYHCEIVQTKSNGQVNKRVENFQLIVDGHREKLTVRMKTDRKRVEVGDTIIIEVWISEEDHSQLKFKWFKSSLNCQDVLVQNNPTSNGPALTIQEVDESCSGVYKCQVTRSNTDENVISAGCDVQINKRSEFDLKIALIIGNANYNMSRLHCSECASFKNDVKHLNPLYSTLELMKDAFEKLNYIVLSFIDLNADEYLRAIRLVRNMCESAKHVSVLVYVAGHGIHSNRHDFLVPVDSVSIVHTNAHNRRCLDHFISLCSLNNLLENFISDDSTGKFNVICLWDLCRKSWDNIDIETTVDNKLKDSLAYTIIYSCFVGEQGYVIGSNYPELQLRKGSIFANLFLKNLNFDQRTLIYQIAEGINNNLKDLRGKPLFKGAKLSNLKINSTLNGVDLYTKVYNHKYYKNLIHSALLLPEQQINHEYDNQGQLLCRHRFLADKFLNSVLLELEFSPLTHIDIDTYKPVDAVMYSCKEMTDWTRVAWRLRNIVGSTQPVKILLKQLNGNTKALILNIPEHFRYRLFNSLYNPEINKYVEEKNSSNDEIYSVASVETDEMTSDNASTTSDSEDFESR